MKKIMIKATLTLKQEQSDTDAEARAEKYKMHSLQVLHFNCKALQIIFSRIMPQTISHPEYNRITFGGMHNKPRYTDIDMPIQFNYDKVHRNVV